MHATATKSSLGTVVHRWFAKASGRQVPEAAPLRSPDFESGLIVNNKSIRAVSIADIADVQSREVFRVIGSTSHIVRFIGGGELCFACDDKGQVIAMSATGLRSEVSAQHVLTVAALNGR